MAKNFNPSELGINFFSLDFFNFKELLNNNKFNILWLSKLNQHYYLLYGR